MFKTINVSRVG